MREEERELVRCLDCGAVYQLPLEQEEALPCPACGGVGWIAVDAPRRGGREKAS